MEMGKIYPTSANIVIWKIRNSFHFLMKERSDLFSPVFSCAGKSWALNLTHSQAWLGLSAYIYDGDPDHFSVQLGVCWESLGKIIMLCDAPRESEYGFNAWKFVKHTSLFDCVASDGAVVIFCDITNLGSAKNSREEIHRILKFELKNIKQSEEEDSFKELDLDSTKEPKTKENEGGVAASQETSSKDDKTKEPKNEENDCVVESQGGLPEDDKTKELKNKESDCIDVESQRSLPKDDKTKKSRNKENCGVAVESQGSLPKDGTCDPQIYYKYKKLPCDAVIKINNTEFNVHRSVLEYNSTKLAEMFDEAQGNVISIHDSDAKVFEELLHFVYYRDLKRLSSCKWVPEIYLVADKYSFLRLKQLCDDYMNSLLNVKTVCSIIHVSKMCGETKLYERATNFFFKHAETILLTPEWQKFNQENWKEANQLLIETFKLRPFRRDMVTNELKEMIYKKMIILTAHPNNQ